jgi:exodeoxyribonuclease VII large subunit
LYEQFLRLKAKLDAEGLFDAAAQARIAAYPSTLGDRDLARCGGIARCADALARRAPHVRAIVIPSPVQGADAPPQLVAAIERASQRDEIDVLIVCRGGGSLEDLWAFNDERVVRAIRGVARAGRRRCRTRDRRDARGLRRGPARTDADGRGRTRRADARGVPAAAAARARRRCIGVRMMRSIAMRSASIAPHCAWPAGAGRARQAERLQALGHRLATHARGRSRPSVRACLAHRRCLQHRAALHLAAHRQRIAALEARLRALDPKQVLARGYAWLVDEHGRPLMSVEQLRPELDVTATLHDGTAEMRVTRSRPTRKLPTMT